MRTFFPVWIGLVDLSPGSRGAQGEAAVWRESQQLENRSNAIDLARIVSIIINKKVKDMRS